MPEDDSRRNGFVYSRSYSVPVENGARKPSRGSSTRSLSPAPPAAGASTEKSSSSSNSGSGSSSNASREPSRNARSRAQSLPHGPSEMRRGHSSSSSSRSSCRLGVRGFLRLADLLHEKVVEAGEGDGDGHDAGEEERVCYMAGFEDDDCDDGVGAGFSPDLAHGALALAVPGGRGSASIRESESDKDEGHSSGDEYGDDEDEESASGGQCCYSGDEGARTGGTGDGTHAPPSSNGVASGGASFSPWQRMERCASCVFSHARATSRRAVGRKWFSSLSKAIAVCLVLLALAWTPRAQQWYDDADGDGDGCVEGEHVECSTPDGDGMDYQREDLLRRLRGAVLLAFLGEMMVKV